MSEQSNAGMAADTTAAESAARQAGVLGSATAQEADDVDVASPEFRQLNPDGEKGQPSTIKRFFDVQVTVSAELGRVTMPIGQLVELGEGSVVELNRAVSSPVDLMAQGVRIATGEVVVIDDCFAVRIKEIDDVQNL